MLTIWWRYIIHCSVFQSEIQGEIWEELPCIVVKSHFHSPFFQPNVQCVNKLGILSWVCAYFSYQGSHFLIAWLQSQPRWWLVYSNVSLGLTLGLLGVPLLQIASGYPKIVWGTVFMKLLCWNKDTFCNLFMYQNVLLMWIILFNLIYCL